jgi:hypothetical protein
MITMKRSLIACCNRNLRFNLAPPMPESKLKTGKSHNSIFTILESAAIL